MLESGELDTLHFNATQQQHSKLDTRQMHTTRRQQRHLTAPISYLRMPNLLRVPGRMSRIVVLILATVAYGLFSMAEGSQILMITMGGTKSHKIPFISLGQGLASRGHQVTFISAFPPDSEAIGAAGSESGWLEEVAPAGLVFYVRNYTNWDLLGARLRGEDPVTAASVLSYGIYACEAFLSDPETQELLHSGRNFDLLILDGAYPECALGLAHHFRAPYMYINTVGFYMGTLSLAGNPAPYAVTPFFGRPFTDSMGLYSRALNTGYMLLLKTMQAALIHVWLQGILRYHISPSVPSIYALAKNVSFTLHNGHATVSYPRAFLPNVAEIACIHCHPPKPLPKHLDDFIKAGGDHGFIYVSMGSSVKASNMPEYLRVLFVQVFSQLPYQVLWKWEAGETDMSDLPPNVMLSRWLPQQDLLGHRKIRAFVTHGGLLSMFETVYHGVPVLTMPVFCDHDANAAKAELDGYALKLELQHLTAEKLLWGINKVIHDPRYRFNALHRSTLLRDQSETPLEKAIFWTEYVLRHRGAYHLQSPAKDMSFIEYFLLDVIALYILVAVALILVTRKICQILSKTLTRQCHIVIKIKTN
ncbi:UDP-glucosyltransferase 2 [Anabrus simplex]|uniref:UDP-glucosyltransferase 2 n=1 Tax=Anabrus simplex TaxID=316456 RepID=UPI0035A3746F